jgi:activating signal cointegrator 1
VKTLSLTQPWASLIIVGAKKVETRSWRTSYTGPLAIHASKGFPVWARETLLHDPDFYEALRGHGTHETLDGIITDRLPLGAVIGYVNLMGCRRTEDVWRQLPEEETKFGDYSPGRFAWFLSNPVARSRPITAKGSLGLWEWNSGERPD